MAQKNDKAQTPAVFERAIDKIRDEMANSKQGYVQAVGEALTEYLQGHPEAEEKLLAKGKTIAGAVKAVEDEARKNKTGNVGVVDPAKGFEIIMGYFGIDAKVSVSIGEAAAAGTSSDPAEGGATFPKGEGTGKPPMEADPFDLDALLGVL